VSVGIRSESVKLGPPAELEVGFKARVVTREPLGAETHLELDLRSADTDPPLIVRTKARGFDAPAVGAEVTAALDPAELHWFEAATGRRLDPGDGPGA